MTTGMYILTTSTAMLIAVVCLVIYIVTWGK